MNDPTSRSHGVASLALTCIVACAISACGSSSNPAAPSTVNAGTDAAANPTDAETTGTTDAGVQLVNSISQYGITWTFDKPYLIGQYLSGDYWVQGPITITSISPAPSGVAAADGSGTYRNGSMVNPMLLNDAPNGYALTHQGYDDRATQWDSKLVVTYPLQLAAGSSLVSTQSVPEVPFTLPIQPDPLLVSGNPAAPFTEAKVIDGTAILNAAVLTVVATPPGADCLRPAFAGTDKTLYCKSQIDMTTLPKLPVPASAPLFPLMQRQLQRPWTGIARNFARAEISAANNEISYGRDLSNLLGDIVLSLCLDYPDAQKETILYGLLQVAIDNFYASKLDTHLWQTNGGYSTGRKLPILVAGLVFNSNDMLSIKADFQEDESTYFGSTTMPAETLWNGWASSTNPYASNVLFTFGGTYEPSTSPSGGADFESTPPTNWANVPYSVPSAGYWAFDKGETYRRLNTPAMVGTSIAARILGLKSAWNHDAFFAYEDRWMNEDGLANRTAIAAAASEGGWDMLDPNASYSWTDPNSVLYTPFEGTVASPFAKEMYMTYRAAYP
jgi:hypothetical protein